MNRFTNMEFIVLFDELPNIKGNFLLFSEFGEVSSYIEKTSNYKGIIILCELNRNEKGNPVRMQELYGIKLAQELRGEGVNAPIVFTSFLSRKQVYADKLERGIINTIGHAFVQLPCSPKDWIKAIAGMEPLNELEMYDIVHNYCSLAGTIRVLMHVLHSYTGTDFRQKVRDAISQAHHLFGQDPTSALLEFYEKFPTLEKENKRAATDFAEEIGNVLIEKFTSSEESTSTLRAEGKWKLLLLDDEIGPVHQLVKELQSRSVEVLCTRRAEEARKVIDDDYHDEKRILVVVSDYRLNEEKDGVLLHQPEQGYRFLKQCSEEKPYLRFVALSALPRKFLMHSFKHYGIRPDIFAKKDYLENSTTLNLLCDELVAIGNENAEAITRLPRITSEQWKLFEPFYYAHRNSDDRKQNELRLSQKAKEYCEGVKAGQFSFDLQGYSVALEGKKKVPTNPKAFSEFLDKMIVRRVAIWYSQYNEHWTLQDVHKVIKGSNYVGNESESTAKNQVNTNLALSLTEFPWNMTLEEKYWLIHVMGFTYIDKVEQQEDELLSWLSPVVSEWFKKHPTFINLLDETQPNAFIRIRKLFSQVTLQLHQHRDSLDSALAMVTRCISEITRRFPSNNKKTVTVILFDRYLRKLTNRLRKIQRLPTNENLTDEQWVKLRDRVIEKAIKKVGKDSEGGVVRRDTENLIENIAWVFFDDLKQDNKTFANDEIYLDELLKEYKKQEFLDPRHVSFMDLQRFRNASDYEIEDEYFEEPDPD